MYIVCYSIQFIQSFIYFHFAANRGRVNNLLARSFALFDLLVNSFTCQFVCLFTCSLTCSFIRSNMFVPLLADPFMYSFCLMYTLLIFILQFMQLITYPGLHFSNPAWTFFSNGWKNVEAVRSLRNWNDFLKTKLFLNIFPTVGKNVEAVRRLRNLIGRLCFKEINQIG